MIVLASIHQPNFEVLSLFDKVLVLANGSAVFSGPPSNIAPFCRDIGHPIATYSNPADHIINLINADFDLENQTILARIDAMRQLNEKQSSSPTLPVNTVPRAKTESSAPSRTSAHFVVLCERALLNYSRNLLAYGIRGAMYVGMAVMMALSQLFYCTLIVFGLMPCVSMDKDRNGPRSCSRQTFRAVLCRCIFKLHERCCEVRVSTQVLRR